MESTTGGSGEVHAHISSQPDKGEGMSGKFDTHGGGAKEFTRRVRERAARRPHHQGVENLTCAPAAFTGWVRRLRLVQHSSVGEKPVFGGKDKVGMFEMNKHLAAHLK